MDIGEAMAEGLQMRLRAWDAYYANPSKETWAVYEAVVEESWALAGEFVQTAVARQSWRRLPEAEAENAVAEARSRRYRPPDEVDSLGAACGAESAAWGKYQAALRKEQERQL